MGLTQEQRDIVECDGKLIAINAFAGTGKTTTLRAYAEARPDERILYLAFNRSVADEASRKMSSNVTVRTSHSIAWREVASKWKKTKLEGKFNAWTMAPFLTHLKQEQRFPVAHASVLLINAFCQSRHASLESFLDSDHAFSIIERYAQDNLLDQCIDSIEGIWERMTDPDNDFPSSHDAYFKVWQMGKPLLDYDTILLDEAQDTNPALFDVFMNQEHATRVLVGDKHQNIYTFRGAMNAMEAIRVPHASLSLTRSFRFGQPVADVANFILKEFKSEKLSITGGGGPSIVTNSAAPPSQTKTAMLFRTNAGLFDAAATLCLKKAQIGLLGRFEDYAFRDIEATYYLMVGNRSKISSAYISTFPSWNALVAYAKQTDDKELQVRIKVVEKYRHDIPRLCRLVRDSIVQDANLMLTTAHKAKGIEWPQVIIGDDFPGLFDEQGRPRCKPHTKEPLEKEEINLWYVSVTRARDRLVIRDGRILDKAA